jgi:glycosyltransferase involved in cell wall biosynthesis
MGNLGRLLFLLAASRAGRSACTSLTPEASELGGSPLLCPAACSRRLWYLRVLNPFSRDVGYVHSGMDIDKCVKMMPEGVRRLRIRVLYFIKSLEVGGSERQLAYLVAHHDRTRFEPNVWCERLGPVARQIRKAGVEIHRFPLADSAGFEMEPAVARLREIRPDVFVSFSLRYDCADVLAAAAARVPVIVTARGNLRHWYSDQKAFAWERIRNLHTDMVVANSRAVAAVVRRAEQLPASKVKVILNGVPYHDSTCCDGALRRELGIGAGIPIVGTVGNLRAVKGHDILLRAFKQMLERVPEARLIVAGANQEPETGLEQLWGQLGLKRRVHFLGQRLDVERVYAALDLYVHSSHTEGMPNAVLEAMAAGLPVIATAVGGVPEAVVDGESGVLVPPGEPSALAEAMLHLLQSPERSRRMGAAGRKLVRRRFRADQMARVYEKTYEELLSRLA